MRKKESRQETRAAAPVPAESSVAPAPTQPAKVDAAPEIVPLTADLRPIDALKAPASEPPGELHFAEAAPSARPQRTSPGRFPLLAASVAAAAALGGVLGSMGHAAIVKFTAAPPVAATDTFKVASKEQAQLKDMLGRLRGDVAALKTEIEGSTKVANAQFAKLFDRVERAEKAQGDPGGKIAKIVETLDRIDRRSAVSTAPTTTASVAPAPAPAAASAAAAAAPPLVQTASAAPETTGSIPQEPRATAPKTPVVEGWLLREVVDGFALIESANGRLFEVGPGSNIPGVGRVESIKRQEGQWVVLTPKGVIAR